MSTVVTLNRGTLERIERLRAAVGKLGGLAGESGGEPVSVDEAVEFAIVYADETMTRRPPGEGRPL